MDEVEKMLKSVLKDNSCENCGHVFEDNGIVFKSKNISYDGVEKVSVFCSAYCLSQFKK